jgi:hypothetical protein
LHLYDIEVHCEKENNGCSILGLLLLWNYHLEGQQWNLLYWNLNALLPQVHPTKHFQKCWSFMAAWGNSQVYAPLRPSQNLDRQCCCTHPSPTGLTSCHPFFTCFILWETLCEDNISWTMKHCRRPSASGCRREYRLLFKDGRKPLTKMKTRLKNNCAFRNVVTKFCETFMFNLQITQNKK